MDEDLNKELSELATGELEYHKKYLELMNKVPEEYKPIIYDIANDELMHWNELNKMITIKCMNDIKPEPKPESESKEITL